MYRLKRERGRNLGTENSATLPALSPAQLAKLRQLTLLDMASSNRNLPYSHILPTLELKSTRQLEEFIIECIYSDLIKARIDQMKQVVEVESVVGRDVQLSRDGRGPKDVGGLIAVLNKWFENASDTLNQLDHVINTLKQKE